MGKKPHKRNGKQAKIRRQNAAAFRKEVGEHLLKEELDDLKKRTQDGEEK